MDKPSDQSVEQPAATDAAGADTARVTPPSPEERRAERVARRKEAEANMSLDEIRAARRARADDRRERLAAMPDDLRAQKEQELAKAKQERLAGRTRS